MSQSSGHCPASAPAEMHENARSRSCHDSLDSVLLIIAMSFPASFILEEPSVAYVSSLSMLLGSPEIFLPFSFFAISIVTKGSSNVLYLIFIPLQQKTCLITQPLIVFWPLTE